MTILRRLACVIGLLLAVAVIVSAATFSEDFDCANSDSLNCDQTWTEEAGDIDIVSNAAQAITGGFGKAFARLSGASTDTVTQYVKWSIVTADTPVYPEIAFRVPSSSGVYYALQTQPQEDLVQWVSYATYTGSSTSIGSAQALTIGNTAHTFGITVEGTGTGTTVRLWSGPSANAPTSVSSWDGGSDPADLTWTDDPGSAADTGTQVGIANYSAGTNVNFDNIFVGDFGGGSPPSTAPRLLLLGVAP